MGGGWVVFSIGVTWEAGMYTSIRIRTALLVHVTFFKVDDLLVDVFVYV